MRRGEPYTLDDFRTRYSLAADEAERLFTKFGPYKVDLDILMRQKRERGESAPPGRGRRLRPDHYPGL